MIAGFIPLVRRSAMSSLRRLLALMSLAPEYRLLRGEGVFGASDAVLSGQVKAAALARPNVPPNPETQTKTMSKTRLTVITSSFRLIIFE
jgi:hypothetical protein